MAKNEIFWKRHLAVRFMKQKWSWIWYLMGLVFVSSKSAYWFRSNCYFYIFHIHYSSDSENSCFDHYFWTSGPILMKQKPNQLSIESRIIFVSQIWPLGGALKKFHILPIFGSIFKKITKGDGIYTHRYPIQNIAKSELNLLVTKSSQKCGCNCHFFWKN